jgi:hypothetical protein
MSGSLSVVATPIGNLSDLTGRAIEVLRSVDLILAEDTRHTGRLLAHIDSGVPQRSLHEHNERARIEEVIALLEGGAHVALVTDAGTPLVSDPGLALVRACIAAGDPGRPGARRVRRARRARRVGTRERPGRVRRVPAAAWRGSDRAARELASSTSRAPSCCSSPRTGRRTTSPTSRTHAGTTARRRCAGS